MFPADEKHMHFHSSLIIMLLSEEKHLMVPKKHCYYRVFKNLLMTHWEIVKNIIFPALPYTHSILDLPAKRVQTPSCRWG